MFAFINLKKSWDLFHNWKSGPAVDLDKQSIDVVLHQLDTQFQLNPITFSLLKLLADRKRLGFLYQILDELHSQKDQADGVVRGQVFSAEKLTDGRREALTDLISQKLEKKVFLDEVVDTNLMSGYRIEVGGFVLDDSFNFQMAQMKEFLLRQTEA